MTQLCKRQPYRVGLRSDAEIAPDMDILIGDTMGELAIFYAAADVAFVGGSLVPVGGHNLLEPAALGIATLTGPHYFNCEEVAEALFDSEAVALVHNSDELAFWVNALFDDVAKRTAMGERGLKMVMDNRGAVVRHLRLIDEVAPHLTKAAPQNE